MAGDWGSRSHQPLCRKQDKRPCRIPIIPNVAFLGDGEVYLRGEPIHLQKWPEDGSQREEVMSAKYHRLRKLPTSSVRLGATNG